MNLSTAKKHRYPIKSEKLMFLDICGKLESYDFFTKYL